MKKTGVTRGERRALRNLSAILLVLILVFFSLLLTSGEKYEPQEKNPLWKEFMKGTEDSLVYFTGNFANRLSLIYSSFTPQIKETGKLTYEDLERYLLANPDLNKTEVSDLISYFITILEPLYVAAIILIGIYLIFFSGSPQGRAKVKSYLLRLILSLVLISITPAIIKLLFSLSEGLTQSIFSLGPSNVIELHKRSINYSLHLFQQVGVADISMALPFLLFSLLITGGVFLILITRYLLVLLFGAVFPLAIFLFSFKPTKSIGRLLLSQLFFWMFLPVSFAIALVAIALGENLFHSILPELWSFDLAGTLALILSPLGMFYATKEVMKVMEKLLQNLSGVEKKIIPELEKIEERKISGREVELQLKEISKEGKINQKELKQSQELYQQLKKEAQKEEEEMAELLKEKYNFKLISEEEHSKRGVTGRKLKRPAEEYVPLIPMIRARTMARVREIIERPLFRESKKEKPLVKGKKIISLNLGLKVAPLEASLTVERERNEKLGIKVNNLTRFVLHEINLTDQDLVEHDIFVDYSEKKFSLGPGESKEIAVTLTVMEGVPIKTYHGTILVTSREGFKNFVDLEVKVEPKEEEKLTEEKMCSELSELADANKKIGLKQLRLKEKLYEKISREAQREEKAIPEYIKEKCGFIILEKKKGKFKLGVGEVERIPSYRPPRKTKEKPKGIEREIKAKVEKKPEKLAPPAPEAPPKIISSS